MRIKKKKNQKKKNEKELVFLKKKFSAVSNLPVW